MIQEVTGDGFKPTTFFNACAQVRAHIVKSLKAKTRHRRHQSRKAALAKDGKGDGFFRYLSPPVTNPSPAVTGATNVELF